MVNKKYKGINETTNYFIQVNAGGCNFTNTVDYQARIDFVANKCYVMSRVSKNLFSTFS